MTRQFRWTLLGIGVLLWGASPGWAQSERTPQSAAARCDALASADLSGIDEAPTQIMSVQRSKPKKGQPAFCQVRGYVIPNVTFNLWLPVSNWNEKFLAFGCGGSCGSAELDRCDRGYACIVSDVGHRGGDLSLDGLWAHNNLQAQVDFGYRGHHVVAVAGKAITERYYGKAPRFSYFWGGSTGGRQALVEAQRFPWDFDGIISGAPWIDDTNSTMAMVWAIRALKGPEGTSIFSYPDLKVLHEAVLAKCDMDDGVKDGLIGNPMACQFDPAELVCRRGRNVGCITAIQSEAAKKLYAGPTNSKGEQTFVRGLMPGSEMYWDWLVPIDKAPEGLDSRSVIEAWATEYFRYMIMPAQGSAWDVTDFDFDRDYKTLGSTSESFLNSANPDLRRFKAAGGKLIVFHGWSDPMGSVPAKTIDYYETVEKVMGGRAATQDFFRVFMVPGMGHGCHNEGACVMEYLSSLEAWVEQGTAPDKVIGAHIDDNYLDAHAKRLEISAAWNSIPGWRKIAAVSQMTPPGPNVPVSFTRPVFPYPFFAKYKGSGDPNKAENFVPATQ